MGDVDTAAAGLRLGPDDAPDRRAWTHLPRTSWGHRGYDEEAVRGFAQEMLTVLEAAERETADLRTEIDRLHRYIRRQWAASDGGQELADPAGTGPSAAQARMVIAQADELAERRAADGRRRIGAAEDEARRRIADAAQQAEQRLAEADRLAAERLARAEDVAAHRLASADAMAEEVLAEARRRAAVRTVRARDECGQVVAGVRGAVRAAGARGAQPGRRGRRHRAGRGR